MRYVKFTIFRCPISMGTRKQTKIILPACYKNYSNFMPVRFLAQLTVIYKLRIKIYDICNSKVPLQLSSLSSEYLSCLSPLKWDTFNTFNILIKGYQTFKIPVTIYFPNYDKKQYVSKITSKNW